MNIEQEIERLLNPERIKKDSEIPESLHAIEKEYLTRLKETGFILTLKDLKIFLHKLLIAKDYYDRREATMRTQAERWKSLREQVMASEKNKINKTSDAERGRIVLAESELYKKADELYHHYNRVYRLFESRRKSAEGKHLACKAILKVDEI